MPEYGVTLEHKARVGHLEYIPTLHIMYGVA